MASSSASSQNMAGATSLADTVKKFGPQQDTLVGGHIAALPKEVLEKASFNRFCLPE